MDRKVSFPLMLMMEDSWRSTSGPGILVGHTSSARSPHLVLSVELDCSFSSSHHGLGTIAAVGALLVPFDKPLHDITLEVTQGYWCAG